MQRLVPSTGGAARVTSIRWLGAAGSRTARRIRLNQYDSIVRPIERWLTGRGVVVEHGTTVVDADFVWDRMGRRVERLHLERAGQPVAYQIAADDLVFMTIGSMTVDATYGDDGHAPQLVKDERAGAWTLWNNIVRKAGGVD